MQDTTDQMTANIADTFLGITHVNCLLCHNGRGHLDSISLWGIQHHPLPGLAAFLLSVAHAVGAAPGHDRATTMSITGRSQDNTKGYTNDYTLNTTSGNRPARVAPAGCKSGQPCYYVAPQYIFNGDTPKPGEDYRAALARDVTGDFQFARAAVNYMWAYFFGTGNRGSAGHLRPGAAGSQQSAAAPWTLQPSNAKLLNALATHFVQSGYDLKALMREIVNSHTYQLSSRYPGPGIAAGISLLCAQVCAAAVGRRDPRRHRAIERHRPQLH